MECHINIKKAMDFLGIKKNSKSHQDYEAAKRWLHYTPCDHADYERYLKEIAKFIGV